MTCDKAAKLPSKIAAWTPVTHVSNVTSHKKRVRLHGLPYILWKNPETMDSMYIADECPHRGASLSLGNVCGDRVRCKYHGASYTGQRALTFDDIVYIETGTSGETFPVVKWEMECKKLRVHTYERTLRDCNPIFMLENTIDHMHLHNVHKFSVVDDVPVVDVINVNTAVYTYKMTDRRVLKVENRFSAPWHTSLRFSINGEFVFSLHTHFSPVSKTETKCIIQVFREDIFGKFGDLCTEFFNELPIVEDTRIVASIPKSRNWQDDNLTLDDTMVALYRKAMIDNHIDLVKMYAI